MNQPTDDSAGFASPPCFAHELEPGPDGFVTVDAQTSLDVARWRRSERQRLIAARLAIPARERQHVADAIAEQLNASLAPEAATIVSLYWPFRGEPNLRGWMQRSVERGVRIALPVVEAKAHPLSFREWTPDGRMEPGIWNIPVPVDGAVLCPTVVIAPLVGFDPEGFRLGYGGGFFDRTLAAMSARGDHPLRIGVGHACALVPSIFPQPHDIPMDVILTGSERIERPTERPSPS